TKNYKQTSV
nr:Chain B, Cysteine-rich PDZ-binding protein [Rattus norvegicus]5HEY_B Chain B, Cysteine-rich PDZ-binding protein [Rattus norvegicus]5HFB_B Chain B, Cysteine-rich PDZ-binding protein [Rattus norvegicus]5HFE_B Chain B, Cysteine-rich PDZ-binding protein [Rattus norvegicus]